MRSTWSRSTRFKKCSIWHLQNSFCFKYDLPIGYIECVSHTQHRMSFVLKLIMWVTSSIENLDPLITNYTLLLFQRLKTLLISIIERTDWCIFCRLFIFWCKCCSAVIVATTTADTINLFIVFFDLRSHICHTLCTQKFLVGSWSWIYVSSIITKNNHNNTGQQLSNFTL